MENFKTNNSLVEQKYCMNYQTNLTTIITTVTNYFQWTMHKSELNGNTYRYRYRYSANTVRGLSNSHDE